MSASCSPNCTNWLICEQGNEIAQVLGYKPGRATADLLAKVIEWQLEHPRADKEACMAWFKEEHQAGKFEELLQAQQSSGPTSKKSKKSK